jgi:beta-phosphoglucomutase-like phosphatase (HAD superfamily)
VQLRSSQPSDLAKPSWSESLSEEIEFDAVFFDFDGVLIVSELIWWTVIEEVLGERGRAIRVRVNGLKLSEAIRLQVPDNEELAAWAEDEVRKRAVPRIKEESQLTDEEWIPRVLDQISEKGIKIGVVSSSDWDLVHDVLTRQNILGYFSEIVGGDDKHVKKGKPAPDAYKEAARRVGVSDRSRCCAVEDSASGIEAAVAAGMYVVQFVIKDDRANSLAVSFPDAGRIILGDAEPRMDP